MTPAQAPAFLPGVHDFSLSFVRGDPLFHEETWRYRFGQRLGRGAFGEAWRAVSLDASMREVVLKRLFIEHGEHVRRSGEREIYFGTMLQHRPHIARFIESFEHSAAVDANGSSVNGPPEMWLVFHNEGFSLTHHMFRVQPGSLVVEMSAFWWLIKRQQPVGGQVIKNVAYQLLHAIAVVHDLNITHRDIKGGNVFMTDTWPPVVRLGDWGSALVTPPTEEVRSLYGPEGPTEDDETSGYQPPEVIFDQGVLARVGMEKAEAWREQAYDMWSFGVLLLELVIGTREIFKVDERRWLREEHALRRQRMPPELMPQARQLQALLDLCIAPAGVPRGTPLTWFFTGGEAVGREEGAEGVPLQHQVLRPEAELTWCADEEFAEVLQQRDAAGIGLPSREGRDLLRRLLSWSPQTRLSARDAMEHRWFDDGAQLPTLRSLQPVAGGGRPLEDDDDDEAGVVGSSGEGADEDDGEIDVEVDTIGAPDADDSEVMNPDEENAEDDEAACASEAPTDLDIVLGNGALASTCLGLRLHAAASSDIGRRSAMEDRHALLNLSSACGDKLGYVAVFDGHGGSDVADRLQRSMHHHLTTDPAYPVDMARALRGAFGAFDDLLQREAGWAAATGSRSPAAAVAPGSSGVNDDRGAGSDAQGAVLRLPVPPVRRRSEAGSTAIVALASGCSLFLANLGDCRAVAGRREPGFGDGVDSTMGRSVADGDEDEGFGSGGCWPAGSLVEVRESPNAELRGQRGLLVELRGRAPRCLHVVRLLRDGELRPVRQSALKLLSELRARRLTEDHKPGSEGERRRIQELGGAVEEPKGPGGPARVAGLATSRSFGSLSARPLVSASPDVSSLELIPGADQFVVLASDGIWDVLEDQLVVDLVWEQISSVHDSRLGPGASLEDAARLVVQTALERGSLDNLTCVILLLSWFSGSSDSAADMCDGQDCPEDAAA